MISSVISAFPRALRNKSQIQQNRIRGVVIAFHESFFEKYFRSYVFYYKR